MSPVEAPHLCWPVLASASSFVEAGETAEFTAPTWMPTLEGEHSEIRGRCRPGQRGSARSPSTWPMDVGGNSRGSRPKAKHAGDRLWCVAA